MTIKQQGGVFGRNPTFNDVSVENSLTVTGDLNVDSNTFFVESSTNRVGINNNNPTQELEVDGTIRVNLGVNDYAVGVVSSGGGGFFLEPDDYTASNPTWKFRTFANENIGMYRGNSDCGTFTANGLAFPNGKGIDFSATSGTGTSELFDDYEEGTWTPSLIGDSGSSGVTYTTRIGRYTKVGNLVHLYFKVAPSGGTLLGGVVALQGFPYTSNNDVQPTGVVEFSGLTSNFVFIGLKANSSIAYFRGRSSASTTTSYVGTGSINMSATVFEGWVTYRT